MSIESSSVAGTRTTGGGIVLALNLLFIPAILLANDSAAEVAPGGIQLRKEARISMEKERLTISLKKVTVEYEFLNTTGQDVTTQVAFPVPTFQYDPAIRLIDFSDFKVWVDGQEIKFHADVRAMINCTDCTLALRGLGIYIQKFGNFDVDERPDKSQFAVLPPDARKRLMTLGLIDEENFPKWKVDVLYHWEQRFPPRKTVHVRHEYDPAIGYEPIDPNRIRTELKEACMSSALAARLNSFRSRKLKSSTIYTDDYVPVSAEWVKYILTTANT